MNDLSKQIWANHDTERTIKLDDDVVTMHFCKQQRLQMHGKFSIFLPTFHVIVYYYLPMPFYSSYNVKNRTPTGKQDIYLGSNAFLTHCHHILLYIHALTMSGCCISPIVC